MNKLGYLVLLLVLCSCASHRLPVTYTKIDKWTQIENKMIDQEYPFMRSIPEINQYVNAVPYISDTENYGRSDYWATPEEFFAKGGDCEDYVIAKYHLILMNGLARAEDMQMVLVQDTVLKVPHALLIVRGQVLDNNLRSPFNIAYLKRGRYNPLGVVNTELASGE